MSVASIGNAIVKHSMDAATLIAARDAYEDGRKLAGELGKNLRDAWKCADTETFAVLQNQLFTDTSSILFSAVRANSKLSPHKRRTIEDCLAIANTESFFLPISEVVSAFPEPKPSGEYRVICEFGLRHRTAQDLVIRAIDCRFVPRSFQYTFRGVQKAVGSVRQTIGNGLLHCATLDIEKCFASFEPKLALHLPLPGEVAEHTVLGRHMAVIMGKGKSSWANSIPIDDLLNQARRGIPTGSACSPIVAAYCMANLKWSSTSEVVLANYSDNFVLLASNAKKLEVAIKELVEAVKDLPGGHFKLRLLQHGSLQDADFDFLGHTIRHKNGAAAIRPTAINEGVYWNELSRLDEKITDALGKGQMKYAVQLLARYYSFSNGWLGTFRESSDIAEWRIFSADEFSKYLGWVGVSKEEVFSAIDPSMGYAPKDYVLSH